MKTLDELKKEGWEFITNFANYWIMGKDNDRMLWCPKTKEVRILYEHKGG